MKYFTEFRYKVTHYSIKDTGWIRVGVEHPNQVKALDYCYDLAQRDSSIIDYRVVILNDGNRVVFQKNCFTPSLEGS